MNKYLSIKVLPAIVTIGNPFVSNESILLFFYSQGSA
jgi:hypothetical protein